MKNVKFRGEKDEFRGAIPRLKPAARREIPRAAENCGP